MGDVVPLRTEVNERSVLPLRQARAHLIQTVDGAAEFMRWLSERGREEIGFDTETTGLNRQHDRVRLVQVGDENDGWAIPFERWGGVVEDLVHRYKGIYTMHNAPFDWQMLAKEGIVIPTRQIVDTRIMAHVLSGTGPLGLKPLCQRHVDPAANAAQEALRIGIGNHGGWTWTTVPITFQPYWMYAALDAILTKRLKNVLWPRVQSEAPNSYSLEQMVMWVCVRMEMKGARIDREYARQFRDQLKIFCDDTVKWCKDYYNTSPGSRKIADILIKEGIELTQRTPSGKMYSLDKYVLEEIDHPLAHAVLGHRRAETLVSTYLDPYLDLTAIGDGRIHPSINTVGGSSKNPFESGGGRGVRTGRMCIPTDHRILTQRGVLSVDEVRPNDQTLDEHGRWTTVRQIHRYDDQPTVIYSLKNRKIKFECTAEHRWMLCPEYNEHGWLEPIDLSKRRRVQLAPSRKVDLYDLTLRTDTTAELMATIFGLLASDGRCVQDDRDGLRAFIYQTERKFYKEIISILSPESIIYDRITVGDHHEIRLSARWLRPRLLEAGFVFDQEGQLLRTHDHLSEWILGTSDVECAAFLRAVWLADGGTSSVRLSGKRISCESTQLAEALQIASYRCGYLSRIVTHAPGQWSTKDRTAIDLSNRWVGTRDLQTSKGRSNVWCVTTDSGTFTAWDQGPYLTGNSMDSPNLQNVPKHTEVGSKIRNCFIPGDGHKWIKCDADQIEMRIFAHLTEDPALIESFMKAKQTGIDMFTTAAREIFMDPTLVKSDERRQHTKNGFYAIIYGAGTEKFAKTAGIFEPNTRKADLAAAQAFLQRLHAMYPGIRQLQNKINQEAIIRQQSEGAAYVRSPLTNRKHIADPDREYTLLNYCIQGTAGEVLKMKIVEADHAGLGEFMMFPVHDEIDLDVPEDQLPDVLHTLDEVMNDDKLFHVPITWSADHGNRWGECE